MTDEDGDNVAVEVLLTGASDWLEYDQSTNSIRKKDQSVAIPAGEYNFIVRLKDDSRLGEKESEWTINLQVFEQLEFIPIVNNNNLVSKALCCRTDYPVPKIKSISTLGDLVISWNKDMQVPQNETYFIEQLNSKVLVSEAGSDTLIEELAFELKLRDNSANTKAINMTWEFDGWSSSREMNFKLTFNNPIAVSVAIEPDFIEVAYRN